METTMNLKAVNMLNEGLVKENKQSNPVLHQQDVIISSCMLWARQFTAGNCAALNEAQESF